MKIETDSLILKNVLIGEWKIPWSIAIEVHAIEEMRRDKKVQICHVLREGNSLTDYFTNLVFDFAGDFIFHNFQEVLSTGRKIINSNKSLLPYIRSRMIKRNLIRTD